MKRITLSLIVLAVLSGCAPAAWLANEGARFLGSFATHPTTVQLKNAVVWSDPRVLTNPGFEGMVHFVAKLSEGTEVEFYCPVEMASRCLEIVPGQQIRGAKGGWIEVFDPSSGDPFGPEAMAADPAAGASRAEARMQGKIGSGSESVAGAESFAAPPNVPKTAVYLRKLRVRPATYAPSKGGK